MFPSVLIMVFGAGEVLRALTGSLLVFRVFCAACSSVLLCFGAGELLFPCIIGSDDVLKDLFLATFANASQQNKQQGGPGLAPTFLRRSAFFENFSRAMLLFVAQIRAFREGMLLAGLRDALCMISIGEMQGQIASAKFAKIREASSTQVLAKFDGGEVACWRAWPCQEQLDPTWERVAIVSNSSRCMHVSRIQYVLASE